MTTLCLHHNDADGRASAAIVRRFFGNDTDCYEMNYGEPVPWETVEGADRVVVVDFSMPLETMEKLAEGRDFIWIDHHKTALEELGAEAERRGWKGVRDVSEAACVLIWRYFFPNEPVPRAIVLIGDRDIWRLAEPDSGIFNSAFYAEPDNSPCNDEFWKPLLDDDPAALERMLERGRILYSEMQQRIRHTVDGKAFPVMFEGHHTLAVNVRGTGETGAYIRSLGYELGYCYFDAWQNGKLYTFVTLYSDRVDASEIARRFGGGGHPGAAGFGFPRGDTPFPPGSSWEWLPEEAEEFKNRSSSVSK